MGGKTLRASPGTAIAAGFGLILVVALVAGPSSAAGHPTPLLGAADLLVETMMQPNPAAVGSVVEFEIVVRNNGTLVAEEVEAIFQIQAVGVSAKTAPPDCTATGSTRLERDGSTSDQPWTVTCDIGLLLPGAETYVTLSVTTGTHGTQMSVVTVSGKDTDVRPSDIRVEAPLYVLPDGPQFSLAFQQPGRLNQSNQAKT